MSPFTEAQHEFLKQMRLSNTDDRAMQIIEAAFLHRNNDALSSEAGVNFADSIDKVAG